MREGARTATESRDMAKPKPETKANGSEKQAGTMLLDREALRGPAPRPEALAGVLRAGQQGPEANAPQRARMVSQIQQNFGNAYTQKVVAASAPEQAKAPASPKPEAKAEAKTETPETPAQAEAAPPPTVEAKQPTKPQEAPAKETTAEETPAEETPAPEPADETKPKSKSKSKAKSKGEGKSGPAPKAAPKSPAGAAAGGAAAGPAASIPPLAAGGSAETATALVTASASQIAANLPTIGGTLQSSLATERTEAAAETPPIVARTPGAPELQPGESPAPATPPAAEVSPGTTEGNPPAPVAEPHHDTAPPPDNTRETREVQQQDEGGFFSWLRNSFNSLMSSISTSDPGVNTSAGERPEFDATGDANPERAANQEAEATTQIDGQQAGAATEIESNDGAQRIQPAAVNEENRVAIEQSVEAIPTDAPEPMTRYAAMPVPAEVRAAADKRMAPLLDQSLAGPRADVQQAATKRDTDRQAAVDDAQRQADELGEQAQRDQDAVVQDSRNQVGEEQRRGVEESERLNTEFQSESSAERTATDTAVNDRISTDQQQADTHITSEEGRAEDERIRGEQEAEQKKQELEKDSDDESWWDRAVSAVKSAVKAVTDAIDKVFDAVRKAVKSILDAAKKFAIDLIEAGRKWVVSKIEAFGKWLKDKVSKYLSAFPGLVAAINGAIDRAVNAAVTAVNAIADGLKRGVAALCDALGKALDAVLSFYQNALKAAVMIAGALLTGDFAEAAKMIFLAACEVLGIPSERILGILNKAGKAISLIFDDVVGFLGNLLAAVGQGMAQFGTNILSHLAQGLMGWLFGALEGAGIRLPTEFTLKAIFGLVLQILGLTPERLRAKAVRLIGERNVEMIEKVWEFVSTLLAEGPAGLWEHIKDFLGNIKDMIFDAIKDWVITKIITAAITKLATMFNPVGAIVQAVLTIYNTVMFFIERINQIIALVEAIVNSIYKIATGAISDAANWVENAMARTIPVIISFLARLIGLGGISEKIRSVIEGIQQWVDKAIDKVIAKVIQTVGRLLGKPAAPERTPEQQEKWNTAVTAVKSDIDAMAADGLQPDEIQAKVPHWKQTYGFTALTLDIKEDKYELDGAMSPGQTVAKGSLKQTGTEDNPIPLPWPKDFISAYPEIYLAPKSETGGVPMPPSDVKKLKGAKLFKPKTGGEVPKSGQSIGVAPAWQTKSGLKIKRKGKSTRGGGVPQFKTLLYQHGYSRTDSVGDTTDMDHVVELQAGGPDDFDNLWPYDSSANRSAGSTLKNTVVEYPGGGKTTVFSDLPESKEIWFKLKAGA